MEGQGGGEVRRIHIIYYLSRKGLIEHPHLIRVHHLSRNGVHLRVFEKYSTDDVVKLASSNIQLVAYKPSAHTIALKDVKRWLSELRGKDMADSFAWSYKRRYKKVFLWQDLVDEDLITPISDNEYVLKGSEISSTFINDLSSYGEEKEVILQKEPQPIDQIDHKNSPKEETEDRPQTPMDDSTQKSSEIEESSPPYSTQTSTVTEDSIKLEEHEDTDSHKEKRQEQQDEEYENGKFGNDSVYSNLLNNNKSKNNGKNSNGSTPDSSTSFGLNSPFMRRKSHRHGVSSMFRSFISCRAVDTMDSATVKINKESKNLTILSNNRREICKGGVCEIRREQQNGGRKSWSGVKDSKKNKKSGFSEQKTFSAAYKPINGPNCSQCGRQFKPEKMHKHMKYCKGMKAFPKSEKTPHNRPTDSPNQDSVSAYYYLTHK